jgi:hypothetical protein
MRRAASVSWRVLQIESDVDSLRFSKLGTVSRQGLTVLGSQ